MDALTHLEMSLQQYRELDDGFYESLVLLVISFVYFRIAEVDTAVRYAETCLQLRQQIGDELGVAYPIGHMGIVHHWAGNVERVKRLYLKLTLLEDNHQAVGGWSEFLRQTFANQGDLTMIPTLSSRERSEIQERGLNLAERLDALGGGMKACLDGDYLFCQQILQRAYEFTYDSPDVIAYFDSINAFAACGLSDFEAARSYTRSSLRYFTRYIYSPWSLLNCVLASAFVIRHDGDNRRATQLLGLFFAHPGTAPVWKEQWQPVRHLCDELETDLGTAAYDLHWQRGSKLDLDETAAVLLDYLKQDHTDKPKYDDNKQNLIEPLTQREQEVLALLAEGWTNSEIAESLTVTLGTVKRHVYNICQKLGAANRTQAVAIARRLNLL